MFSIKNLRTTSPPTRTPPIYQPHHKILSTSQVGIVNLLDGYCQLNRADRLPIVHRPAGIGRKAGAEDHAGVRQLGIGHHAFATNRLLASATIDRLRHNSYCLELDGPAYRDPKVGPAPKKIPDRAPKSAAK